MKMIKILDWLYDNTGPQGLCFMAGLLASLVLFIPAWIWGSFASYAGMVVGTTIACLFNGIIIRLLLVK